MLSWQWLGWIAIKDFYNIPLTAKIFFLAVAGF